MISSLLSLYISLVSFATGQNALFAEKPRVEILPWQTAAAPEVSMPEERLMPQTPQPAPISMLLDVPFHRQIYTLSCEAASLQMALEYYDVFKNQDQLLEQIGKAEPYASYYKNDVMIWGDPNLGFVGNVNGLFSTPGAGMYGATGWGVNKDPIARVAKTYRPNSEAYSGYTSTDVMRELDAGHPVIFWHVPDSYALGSLTYETPAGKKIKFFRNHVAVISGYIKTDNAITFEITDPLYGVYNLKQSTLDRRMAKYDGDVVVVR